MTAPAASAEAPSARSFSGAGLQSLGQIAIVVLLLAGAFIWMGPQQFVNALTIGAIYALIAIGYTMVYGIIELINFAHGDVFMVGTFVMSEPGTWPKRMAVTPMDRNAPTMNTSPWAKLMSSMIP